MPQKITTGYKQLMAEAEAQVAEVTAAEAVAMLATPDVTIIDIRDPREIERADRYKADWERRFPQGG